MWGYETPVGNEGLPWDGWKFKESAVAARYDLSYGVLQIRSGEEFVSTVVDFGSSSERYLITAYDTYDTGTGTGTIQWRGHDSVSFNQEDDEIDGPVWEAYSASNKTWRYAQLKVTG